MPNSINSRGTNSSSKNNHSVSHFKNIFIIGTKTGQCPVCAETKTLILLRYGVCICEDCLTIWGKIIEQTTSPEKTKFKLKTT